MPFIPQLGNMLNITDGPSELYINNVFVGATQEGVALQCQSTINEILPDSTPLVLGHLLEKYTAMVTATLMETDITNLRKILATPTGAPKAGFGSSLLPAAIDLKILTRGPNDTERTYHFFKARPFVNTDVSLKIGSVAAYKVEFKIEADPSKADGNQYFTVEDVAPPAPAPTPPGPTPPGPTPGPTPPGP